MAEKELYVCDRDFNRFAVIDDYISMVWTDRYTKHGDIQVVFNSSSPNLKSIILDYYFSFSESDSHMIIETILEDEEKGLTTVTGRCLKVLLERRMNRDHVLGTDQIEQSAGGAMTETVEKNCLQGYGGQAFKKFLIGDHYLPWGGGPNSIRDNSAKDVYSEVVSICDEVLVGWKLEWRHSYRYNAGGPTYWRHLVFHTYVGVDRSVGNTDNRTPVIFDPSLDNIQEVTRLQSRASYSNIFGIRWGSNGKGWTMHYAAAPRVDDYNINMRYSLYTPEVELADMPSSSIVKAYGRSAAVSAQEVHLIDGTILAQGPFQYNWDYGMGDLVTIGQDSATNQHGRVVEYIWNHDENGWSHYPTFKVVDD